MEGLVEMMRMIVEVEIGILLIVMMTRKIVFQILLTMALHQGLPETNTLVTKDKKGKVRYSHQIQGLEHHRTIVHLPE